jgi:PPOX class probable F420-dependent enzyme
LTSVDDLWRIVEGARNGILATNGEDGCPQLSNIYYLVDPTSRVVRFSTTAVRTKGRNLLRDPRATMHVAGQDFYTFAVVTGVVSIARPGGPEDPAVDLLFEIHTALGATADRDEFGEQMLDAHRMAVELRVARIYGQILHR